MTDGKTGSPNAGTPGRPPAARWVGPTVVGFVGVLPAWTWGRWADVIMDFGREAYVPWRLVEGGALYSDMAYFNSPSRPA